MRRHIPHILALWAACTATSSAQTLQEVFARHLGNYERADAQINPKSTLVECDVDDGKQRIRLVCGGGFAEQFFTEEAVAKIYRDFRAQLPARYARYDLTIVTDSLPIHDLIPNAARRGRQDDARKWKHESHAAPWVTNLSQPYAVTDGLNGTHLSLWQSHGRYYDTAKDTWKWQRPRLFGTCEDLFTQTFVIPYIIPMLENAGAIVFTPRERDWQKHEVIVDNDTPRKNGAYMEHSAKKGARHQWAATAIPGFAHLKAAYAAADHPFADGTARYTAATSAKGAATAQWIPNIPESGKYAVYVSYQSLPNSIDDAQYTVYHKGGATRFAINQQMGGGTWVYLGTFEFDKGQHDYGMVALTSQSKGHGVVTADAVRFGGGMGNIVKGGATSGLPRFAEGARYSAQWAGLTDTVYDNYRGLDDYKSDILCRPYATNELGGGSAYLPHRQGRRVPFELALAFHSDAGISPTDQPYGSLAVCTTGFYDGVTAAGVSRYASRDLANMLLANLNTDLRRYGWQVRKLWNRNYGETREPQVPSVILEMLSHQNFADVQLGYDPQFKFDFCRSVYKTVVKHLATMHNRKYVIQPLPVTDFAVQLDEQRGNAVLTWQPVDDPGEPTARPARYVVYTRRGYGDFDNGTLVSGTSHAVHLRPDEIYSFRVCAVNKGGRSFPSETLAACIASKNTGTALIVNAFTRLSGPASFNTATRQGFDLDADPGVPYGAFAGYCGRQVVADKTRVGSLSTSGLGYSGSELEGTVMMGNTFDYVFLHGKGIQLTGRHSFASCSESALLKGRIPAPSASRYQMMDIVFGTQTQFNPQTSQLVEQYCRQGGSILLTGGNLFKRQGVACATTLKCSYGGSIADKSVREVNGCGLVFDIYRDINPQSYSVPCPETCYPAGNAFAMLAYANGSPAAVAYDGSDYKAVTFGFPLEAITDPTSRNRLMGAVVNFLCNQPHTP